MTPELRAEALIEKHYPDVQGQRWIAEAIREAVAAERERCEGIARAAAAEPGIDPFCCKPTAEDIAAAIREGGTTQPAMPAWLDEMPDRRGWWLYRDERGAYWLCFCENDAGSELTWRGEIPPGAWDGQWC